VSRRSLAWLLAFVVVAVVAACGPSQRASPAPPSLPPSPIDGVIVGVAGTGLSDVTGFTLRTASGATIVFKLGTLENPTQFAPGHLKEHEATSQPVRVFFVAGPDGPVVYRLEDAPGSSPPPSGG
jgi:hypothetical protein